METLLKRLEDRLLSEGDGSLISDEDEFAQLGDSFLDEISASHASGFASGHASCSPPTCS